MCSRRSGPTSPIMPRIEEVQRLLVRLPHQVPGVRVGVEEAVDEDLLVEGLEQLPSRLPAGPSGAEAAGAAYVLHHQEPGGRVVRVHHRHPDRE